MSVDEISEGINALLLVQRMCNVIFSGTHVEKYPNKITNKKSLNITRQTDNLAVYSRVNQTVSHDHINNGSNSPMTKQTGDPLLNLK